MAIQSIIAQPTENSYHAAYRPIAVRVTATANFGGGLVPPVVYCDIYFNDVYYKTLSKTQYTLLNGGNSEWLFDLQDAAQEYLTKYISPIALATTEEVTANIVETFCRIRCSGINDDGFIESDGTVPVQGTSSSDPVAGTGEETNTFFIVNATLQHTDVQDLAVHLDYFKQRTWANDVQPLTHRPEGYGILPAQSDTFPIIDSGEHTVQSLRLNYRNCNQTTFAQATIGSGITPQCTAVISDPVAVHNGLGWLVSWSVVSGTPGKFFVSTPALSGGAPYEVTTNYIQWPELAEGSHLVTVQPLCLISGDYYFGASKTVTIVVEACVAVGISTGETLPTAYADVPYNESVALTGTAPFTIENITAPAWMTVTLIGSFVQLTGTPDSGDIDEDVPVEFDVENACGTDSYVGTVDVQEVIAEGSFQAANSASGVSIDSIIPAFYALTTGSFPMANGQSGDGTVSAYVGSIGVNITKVGGPTAYLRLTVNAGLVQCLSVTGSGAYVLDPTTIAADDDVEIVVSPTPC